MANRHLVDANPAIVAALRHGTDTAHLISTSRAPTAHQRTALQAAGRRCAVEGCTAPHNLQYDHRIDWAELLVTFTGWIDLLCWWHHDVKTHQGWALVDGTGPRAVVPPGDPRHPRQPAA